MDEIISSPVAAKRYLNQFDGTGVEIAGLNCNGNPLHPNPAIGQAHAADIERSVRAAAALGQTRVVTMSGLPGAEAGASVPNWFVNAWNSASLDAIDRQFDVAVAIGSESTGLPETTGSRSRSNTSAERGL